MPGLLWIFNYKFSLHVTSKPFLFLFLPVIWQMNMIEPLRVINATWSVNNFATEYSWLSENSLSLPLQIHHVDWLAGSFSRMSCSPITCNHKGAGIGPADPATAGPKSLVHQESPQLIYINCNQATLKFYFIVACLY